MKLTCDLAPHARWAGRASLLALAAALAACGGSEGESKDKPATQVAAKVNKEELSVHQINFVLQRQPNLKPEQIEPASRAILERLIDQEIAVQKAIEQKVDRDPRVVQAIEAARREIIARAYADRVGNAATPPSDAEVADYYAKQPALFSQRRVYQLQEFIVQGEPAALEALKAKVEAVKAPAQLAEVLKASGLKVQASQAVRAAEQLPLASLERFATLKDGQTLINVGGGSMQVILLAGSRSAPIDEARAKPAIQRFLSNERKRALVAEDLKSLRAAAAIEYVGKFADKSGAAASAPELAPVVTEPASDGAAVNNDTLNRGLQGLK